jgi:hypothetical protein
MNRTANREKSSRKPSMRQLLRREPKMSTAKNRRLNALIDRSKAGKLTAKEKKELSSLVETVDRQSFVMVANALMKYLGAHGKLPSATRCAK